ncbi:DUF4912 domain-containing protein [Lyngbya confervoides]|uniref:DUF4912 domain-containing protein n=1 Tax=Lyngbya confervoides BDU141951 TaxID=1574623 RepID=A0ABD4SYY4_9CYAN|nr:DUF4912 domain-containing protein [Lyngbya confervoides]MCM1981310.1 DUF4912 domain-containing protein [Lyngbya confervoides BDU141951]
MDQNPIPLIEMTLRQLRKVASRLGVSRYSRMRKEELLSAIQSLSPEAPSQPYEETMTDSPASTPFISGSTPSSPGPGANQRSGLPSQERVEAAKFELGSEEAVAELASVDEGLPDLPEGYGESRIVLLPRDPQWAFVYWDVPNEHKEDLRRQGGQQIALRLCDATDIDITLQAPHSVQEYPCDELAREWYLPIPVSDRDYVIEIGYRCADGRWLLLTRSAVVHIPPTYPSDWVEDIFMTVDWNMDLRGKTLAKLVPPALRTGGEAGVSKEGYLIHDQIFGLAGDVEAQRVAGSLFGSMQQVPQETLSSFVFPSGIGQWAIPTASGLGFSASVPHSRPRKFWLIADAELIVYGATEPDATVTIGDRKIDLSPDGTFRFQMSFQDGNIDYPIKAVAADGEQNREIHMTFTRQTLARRTNTKEEAVEEWLI